MLLLDPQDQHLLLCATRRFQEYRDGKLYVASGSSKTSVTYLHRKILGVEDKTLQVDHVNGDGLDNRRQNLRVATRSQNQCNRGRPKNNTSGFKGVSWVERRSRWIAQINVLGKRHCLGHYNTPEEAHAAYCTAAKRLHGEFAKTC